MLRHIDRHVAIPLRIAISAAMLVRALVIVLFLVLVMILAFFLGVSLIGHGGVKRVSWGWWCGVALTLKVMSEVCRARRREVSWPKHR